ncbi:MAG: GNAT family N-acetyltransferase [Deltaproteobacteria bacterium]|nr:GNAT family N-acetyltransferase [Deltaproteobacteria bacterium]
MLREATRLDAHAIARILKEVSDLGLVARADEVDPAAVSRQIEVARAAANSLVIVAAVPDRAVPDHEDDKVIGLLTLEGAPLLRLHDVARLNMAVTPAFHSQGIGRELVEYATHCADASGQIRKIELLIRANNDRALRLFEGLGFVEEGRLRARLRRDDGSYVDDVCMARFKPEQGR